jgi:hypothetical protein
MSVALAMYCCSHLICRSMSDDEDVGGIRLVDARHGCVFLVGVRRDDLPPPRLQCKW